MSSGEVKNPFGFFTATDGTALDAGSIYLGVANLDPVANPISAFWDAALTIPAAQPIKTISGYPSRGGTPAKVFTASDYSILVQTKTGALVYSSPAGNDNLLSWLGDATDVTKGDALIAVKAPVTNGAARTQHQKNTDYFTTLDLVGADSTGATNSDAALTSAIAAIDKNIGGTIHVTPGYYKLGAISIDGYNNLKIEGDEGTYFLCTTTGTWFDILDCRRFTMQGIKYYGRANTTVTQDRMPALTGVVEPARAFYIHERQTSTRQSEFIEISRGCYYGNNSGAGTTVVCEIGDSGIASNFHQPSDVYFDDFVASDIASFLKVSQVNCQSIYATRISAGNVANEIFSITAGDLFADGVQCSGLAASAYMLRILPTNDEDVKRVVVQNYWNETIGAVVQTNLKTITDRLDIQITRMNTTGLTWPFDIQCKNTVVRLRTVDSLFSAGGVATSFMRVNQTAKLILEGATWSLAGQPVCNFQIVDDAAATVDSFATQIAADSTLPLTTFAKPNLIPGSGGAAVLGRESSYGDGFNTFYVGTDGTISIDKKAAGTVTAFTDYFDVVAGQIYTSSMLMQENPIGTGYLWSIFFYDKAGVQITELQTVFYTNTLTTAWLGRSGTVTAPALAAYARVRIGLTGTGFLAYKNLKVEKSSFSTPFVVGPKRDPRIVLSADPVSGFWKVQDIYYKSAPASAGYVGKVCTVAGFAVKGVWVTATTYNYGDYVSNAGKVYQCTSTTGTSGATAPVHTSGTVSDGSLNWLFVATSGQPTWNDFGVIA